jgi:hypothetical protein
MLPTLVSIVTLQGPIDPMRRKTSSICILLSSGAQMDGGLDQSRQSQEAGSLKNRAAAGLYVRAKLGRSVTETFFTSCANELARVELRSNLELRRNSIVFLSGLWFVKKIIKVN